MVVGSARGRRPGRADLPRGHRLGNRMLTGAVAQLFGGGLSDMLSGYRVFSRRYAKSFPALSQRLRDRNRTDRARARTAHALSPRKHCAYSTRPEGSVSKLSTYRDGWRILKTICKLFVSERPLQFFSIIAGAAGADVGRAGLAARHDLHAHRPGAPAAHGGAGHRVRCWLPCCPSCAALCMQAITLGRREAKRL